MDEIDPVLAWRLSERLDGHPLSLFLLGKAFNEDSISLQAFINDYEKHLFAAENKYIDVSRSQRTLYASIDTSVRYLTAELRDLLSKLWLFHSPFLLEAAAVLFGAVNDEQESVSLHIGENLFALWQRGFLTLELEFEGEDVLKLYYAQPVIRSYIEAYLAKKDESEKLLAQFGRTYAGLAESLYRNLKQREKTAYIALRCREDLERGVFQVTGTEQGYYLLHWGGVLSHLGDRRRGLVVLQKLVTEDTERGGPLLVQLMPPLQTGGR
jgi:hypothetical protein